MKGRPGPARKRDDKGSPETGLAQDFDLAAILTEQFPAIVQSNAQSHGPGRPFRRGLGAEKGIEDLFLLFDADSRSIVVDADIDVAFIVPAGNSQSWRGLIAHRLDGVSQDIAEDLTELDGNPLEQG